MSTKPNNDTIGPTWIRRVEKISGLNSVAPLGSPIIKTKPITIIKNETAIRIRLHLGKLYRILNRIKGLILLHEIQVVSLHPDVPIDRKHRSKESDKHTDNEYHSRYQTDIHRCQFKQPEAEAIIDEIDDSCD